MLFTFSPSNSLIHCACRYYLKKKSRRYLFATETITYKVNLFCYKYKWLHVFCNKPAPTRNDATARCQRVTSLILCVILCRMAHTHIIKVNKTYKKENKPMTNKVRKRNKLLNQIYFNFRNLFDNNYCVDNAKRI